MKREEIVHLATLSRITLTGKELENLEGELSSIVSYVSVISDIVSDDVAPAVGARHNIFRSDEVTNIADEYTADMIAEMPRSEGRYMKVQKILNTDE